MATWAARATASSAFIRYSKVDESSSPIRILGYGGSNPRWASSSSSKPNKKMSDRLSSVIDAVNDRKLPPELRGQRNAIRSETEIINVVEQRIWHSMEEGQFDNLPGKGKPFPDLLNNCSSNNNPHADPAEDTLYRILSRNNCAPEWVELNKEIRNNIAEWRSSLHRAVLLHLHTEDGSRNNTKWIQCSDALKPNCVPSMIRCSGTTSLFLLAARCLDSSGRKN